MKRKERKQWHKLLDQIIDLSEAKDNDWKSSDEPKIITYEEHINREDKAAQRAYQTLLHYSELSHLVEGQLMLLSDTLHNHHTENRLSPKENLVYHKLLGMMVGLDGKKYPSRVKIFHKLSKKISKVEDTRNFMAFCIDNHLPLHTPHEWELSKALRSLNDGQTPNLLKASSTGKWRVNITAIKQLKFIAICQVSILMGIKKGRKKHQAITIVSKYYHCSEETIAQWAKRDLLDYFPKAFLKKIHPILMAIGEMGFREKEDKKELFTGWAESTVYFEENPIEFLWHFFMNPYGNNIRKCEKLYTKAQNATSEGSSITVSGYPELIKTLHMLTNTKERPLMVIDDIINNYS